MTEANIKKGSLATFVIAAIFLFAAATNWYFYFNPTIYVSEIHPIGLNLETFAHACGLLVSVFFIIKVQTRLGKIFWGFLSIGILLQLGWKILLVNVPIETYDMVGRIQLTIFALILLIFAVLEKLRGESIMGLNKEKSA